MDRRLFVASLVTTAFAGIAPSGARADAGMGHTKETVPQAYIDVALPLRIPPVLLFAVACKESEMLFGVGHPRRIVPWPWTLNVSGRPYRFRSHAEAAATARAAILRGERSVDLGLMQVNWLYHRDLLVSPEQGLMPMHNLRSGARILCDHYRDTGDWTVAVGRYHAPADAIRGRRYAREVMRRVERTLRG